MRFSSSDGRAARTRRRSPDWAHSRRATWPTAPRSGRAIAGADSTPTLGAVTRSGREVKTTRRSPRPASAWITLRAKTPSPVGRSPTIAALIAIVRGTGLLIRSRWLGAPIERGQLTRDDGVRVVRLDSILTAFREPAAAGRVGEQGAQRSASRLPRR